MENPSVGSAVGHFKSLAKKAHGQFIRERISLLNLLPQISGILPFSPHLILAELIDVYKNELILRRQVKCVLSQLNSWWSHEGNAGRFPWSVTIFEGKHPRHFFNNLFLALVAINLDDLAHELLLDPLDVDSVLSDRISGDLVEFEFIGELSSCSALD